jgi:syntaxin-binding protein 1
MSTLLVYRIDIALEQQVFSFDMPLSLFPLFSPSSASQQNVELQKIAKKLMSLLITLGDAPAIRYYDPKASGESVSAKLAKMLENDIENLQQVDSSYPEQNDYKKTILLICDRSFDMMAPLLHEFTYQAMFQDLVCGDKAKQPDLQGAGIAHPLYFAPLSAYTTLDETDTIWSLIKHWHFAEAVDYILNSFNKFLQENKAASAALGTTRYTTLTKCSDRNRRS